MFYGVTTSLGSYILKNSFRTKTDELCKSNLVIFKKGKVLVPVFKYQCLPNGTCFLFFSDIDQCFLRNV